MCWINWSHKVVQLDFKVSIFKKLIIWVRKFFVLICDLRLLIKNIIDCGGRVFYMEIAWAWFDTVEIFIICDCWKLLLTVTIDLLYWDTDFESILLDSEQNDYIFNMNLKTHILKVCLGCRMRYITTLKKLTPPHTRYATGLTHLTRGLHTALSVSFVEQNYSGNHQILQLSYFNN